MEHAWPSPSSPTDGIRIDAHLIRRVTTYDGALLEEARPAAGSDIHVRRRWRAPWWRCWRTSSTLEPAWAPRRWGGRLAGKTGTTNDFTDAWYMGFTPQLTAEVRVGFDDKQKSLGRSETGARAALPIWLQFMQNALADAPVENFPMSCPSKRSR